MFLSGVSREEINKTFADLLTILQNPDPEVELDVANSLWARKGLEFNEAFISQNRDFYDAEITALEFSDPEAAGVINDWVREQTGEKIYGIVEPPINPETILFLINAFYFKSSWSEEFDPEQIRKISFNLPDGKEKEHPVMFKNDDFEYLETDLFQAARLPYGESEWIAMTLFLPAGDITLEHFLMELDEEK